MNVHDSERMAGLLEQAGYEPATDDRDADVIVINTCSVREHAEEKLYTRLGELRVLEEETGHRRVVAVAGCVAQQEGDALFKNVNGRLIDVVLGTQRLKMLPVLVERRGGGRTPPCEVDVAALRRRHVPGRRDAARRRRPRLRHDHRRLQRPLRLLRRAEHPRARADARQGRHPARRPRGGGLRPQGDSAPRADRQPLPGARRPGVRLRAAARRGGQVPGVERIRFASPHPRHTGRAPDRGGSRPAARLQAPPPAAAVRLHASAARACAGATRARSTSTWSGGFARRFPASRCRPTSSSASRARRREDFDDTMSLVEAVRYHSIFSFKYSERPNTLARQADARRRARGGEDRPHRGAAGAAEGDPERAARRGGRAGRRGAGGLGEPPARAPSSPGARAATRW